MVSRSTVQEAIDAGSGILRLDPSWVPRTFMLPGRRLKLHPDDLYALGGHRGGINERWFSSTTNADNGPGTPPNEGLSYVRLGDGKRFLLKDAVEAAGDLLIGSAVMQRDGGWNLLCKFFDNMGPIPHHMHQRDEDARRVGRRGNPRRTTFHRSTTSSTTNFRTRSWGSSQARRKPTCAGVWRIGTKAITVFSSSPVPSGSNPAPDGRSIRASCTRLVRSSPTNRRSTATFSRCFSPRWKAESSTGAC